MSLVNVKDHFFFLKGLEKNISARCLDVTNKASILDLAKEVEKIDILFNCAGYDFIRI